MLAVFPNRLASLDVPENDLLVHAATAQLGIVARPTGVHDLVAMAHVCLEQQSPMWVPQLQGLVAAARQTVVAVDWKKAHY